MLNLEVVSLTYSIYTVGIVWDQFTGQGLEIGFIVTLED